MRFYQRATVGAEAGLMAGAAVILLFLVQDVVQLAPLATPEALATSLFGPAGFQYDTGLLSQAGAVAVFGVRLISYTFLHFLAFAALGIGGAFALSHASWAASLMGGGAYGLTACTAVFYGSRLVMDTPVLLEGVGLPAILVANTVAGVVIGGGLHLVRSPDAEEG